MKIRKEIPIALLVLISIGMLYFGFGYLKGNNVFNQGRVYYAVYNNIAGISIDDPVSVNGYRIGKIRELYLLPIQDKVVIEVEIIHNEVQIPEDSRAVIVNTGLLGGKEIDIELGKSVVMIEEEDTIPSGTEQDIFSSLSSSLEPFEKKALEAVVSIDSVMKLVQLVLNEKNRTNLDKSMQNLAVTMQNLNASSNDVKGLIAAEKARIGDVMKNLKTVSANLKVFSDSLKDVDIKQTLVKVDSALYNANLMIANMNAGKGTAGQLLTNDSLYQYLESASKDLDLLLIDMKENPRRYVHFSLFGRKDKSEN